MDYYKGEEGISLIEVMAALVVLSLTAVTFLTVFTTGSQWIRSAGDKKIAVQYASSVIEGLHAQSAQLDNLQMPASGIIQMSDSNEGDGEFNLNWEQEGSPLLTINVFAPNDIIAEAILKIYPYNEILCYSNEYNDEVIDADGDGIKRLVAISVDIKWQDRNNNRTFTLATIMGVP